MLGFYTTNAVDVIRRDLSFQGLFREEDQYKSQDSDVELLLEFGYGLGFDMHCDTEFRALMF